MFVFLARFCHSTIENYSRLIRSVPSCAVMYATRSKSKATKLSDCTNTYGNSNTVLTNDQIKKQPIQDTKPIARAKKPELTAEKPSKVKAVKAEMNVNDENSESLTSSSKYFAQTSSASASTPGISGVLEHHKWLLNSGAAQTSSAASASGPAISGVSDYHKWLLNNGVKSEPTEEDSSEYFRLPKSEIDNQEVELKHKIKSEDDDLESASKRTKWEPANWREVFGLIRQMRQTQDAPVDTMGCDALSSVDASTNPKERRFQVLVSLMLSAQTKDEVTAAAMNKLLKELPLNIETACSANEETISQLIYPVSFYRRKAQYIKRTAQILQDAYDSDIPNNVTELCKLPGVGPKMAYITMHVAWNNCAGIGVDTHVHRISNRLGWTRKATKIPEQTRKELEEWLPQELWNEVNHMLVGFGQQTCRPIGPKCGICLAKDLCPTGRSYSPKKGNKAKSKTEIKIESNE